MPHSLRSRVKKMAHKGFITYEEADRIREALAKQMPMKADMVTTKDDEFIGMSCPRCKVVEFGLNQPNYCEVCGQKLDWSEVE